MKKLILFLLLLFAFQSIFAQNQAEAYKIAEYERNGGGSCEEFFRIYDLIERIKQDEESRGLIVIYSGNDNKRFGNILAYISGVKESIPYYYKVPSDKISFIIAKGKSFFNEEFWIIPKDAKFPEIENDNFDFSNLNSKFLFSETCLICEPSYQRLTSFQEGLNEYAEVLKKHKNYQALIEIEYEGGQWEKANLKQVRTFAAYYRTELTKKHGIENQRVTIKINKSLKEESSSTVNFFIMPFAKK